MLCANDPRATRVFNSSRPSQGDISLATQFIHGDMIHAGGAAAKLQAAGGVRSLAFDVSTPLQLSSGEALAPLTRGRAGAIGSPRLPWDMVSTLLRGGKPRAVAQLGSALDWGSRGRRFKSCQPDRCEVPGHR